MEITMMSVGNENSPGRDATSRVTEIILGQDDSCRDIVARCELIGRKMHLLRMLTPDQGGVAVCDARRDTTGWYEILAVGPECKYFGPEHIGKAVWLPNNPIGKKIWSWMVGPAERIVDEAWWDEPDGPPLMVVETED
jgi:hypothetical protein